MGWALTSNIKGASGSPGATGATGATGASGASGVPGASGAGGVSWPLSDSDFAIADNGDATKIVKLEVSGVTTNTTRTLTVPNASTTIVGTGTTQALTNKDLTDSSNTFPSTLLTTTNTVSVSNKTLTGPVVNGYTEGATGVSPGASGTLAISSATVQTVTLTSATACTLTLPTATAGQSFLLFIKQPSSGTATTVSWAASPPVKWAGGVAPVITATVGRLDMISFTSDGTNWYGSFVQNFTY